MGGVGLAVTVGKAFTLRISPKQHSSSRQALSQKCQKWAAILLMWTEKNLLARLFQLPGFRLLSMCTCKSACYEREVFRKITSAVRLIYWPHMCMHTVSNLCLMSRERSELYQKTLMVELRKLGCLKIPHILLHKAIPSNSSPNSTGNCNRKKSHKRLISPACIPCAGHFSSRAQWNAN